MPEIFADEAANREETPSAELFVRRDTTLSQILLGSWQIYRQGFWRFLGLTALAVVPSICAQLSSATVGVPPSGELDLRAGLAGVFNFGMVLTSLFTWPLYVAGIQILTAEIAQGRSLWLDRDHPKRTQILAPCRRVFVFSFIALSFSSLRSPSPSS